MQRRVTVKTNLTTSHTKDHTKPYGRSVLSIMIAKLPSPSPDVASTNAKRQARPLAHADAAKPKKRSSRCVSGSVQCKWSTWKRLTKSDGPMLMD